MIRSIEQSLANAQRIETELPLLLQPFTEDYDMINMKIHIDYQEQLIKKLTYQLREQLNDCINFDGAKLTDCIMKASSDLLKEI